MTKTKEARKMRVKQAASFHCFLRILRCGKYPAQRSSIWPTFTLSLSLFASLPPSLSHFSICVPAAREFEVGRAPKNLQMARSHYRNCAEGESAQSWHGPHEHEMTRALQGLQANLMVLSRRRAHGAIARW